MNTRRLVRDIVRTSVLVWACGLVTWSIVYVLTQTPSIGVDAAAVLTAIITVLTAAVGLYEWRLGSHDASNVEPD